MKKHAGNPVESGPDEGLLHICGQLLRRVSRSSMRMLRARQPQQDLVDLAQTAATRASPGFSSGTATALLLIGNDAHDTDATRLLLSLTRTLSQQPGIQLRVLLKQGGTCLPEFMNTANTAVLQSGSIGEQLNWLQACGCQHAIFNSCATGDLLEAAQLAGMSCVVLAHELSSIIQDDCLQPQVSEIAHLAQHVVFPSAVVRADFEQHEPYIRGSINIMTPGPEQTGSRSGSDSETLRRRLGMHPNEQLIIGSGLASQRRGFDLFVLAAQRLCKTQENLHFCWNGARTREMKQWLRTLSRGSLKGRLHLLDEPRCRDAWLAAADCLYLSSRIDSCPRSVLQAMALGKPVVVHEAATGLDESLLSLLLQAAIEDGHAVDNALLEAVHEDSAEKALQRQACIREHQSLNAYARELLQLLNLPVQQKGARSDLSGWLAQETLFSTKH